MVSPFVFWNFGKKHAFINKHRLIKVKQFCENVAEVLNFCLNADCFLSEICTLFFWGFLQGQIVQEYSLPMRWKLLTGET